MDANTGSLAGLQIISHKPDNHLFGHNLLSVQPSSEIGSQLQLSSA
jgi:hypothetical protein